MNIKNDLELINKQCLLLLNFIKSSTGDETMDVYFEAVEIAYKKKNIKGLKSALNDLFYWIKDFGYFSDSALESILTEIEKNQKVKIYEILKRGLIKSKNEYKIISDFVDEYYVYSDERENIEKANLLLTNYSIYF